MGRGGNTRKRLCGTGQGYLWTCAKPGGDVLFHWETSRSADCLAKVLPADITGTPQCDGYAAYATFARKHPHPVTLGACAAKVLRSPGRVPKNQWKVTAPNPVALSSGVLAPGPERRPEAAIGTSRGPQSDDPETDLAIPRADPIASSSKIPPRSGDHIHSRPEAGVGGLPERRSGGDRQQHRRKRGTADGGGKELCRDPDYAEYGGRFGTGTTLRAAPVPGNGCLSTQHNLCASRKRISGSFLGREVLRDRGGSRAANVRRFISRSAST